MLSIDAKSGGPGPSFGDRVSRRGVVDRFRPTRLRSASCSANRYSVGDPNRAVAQRSR
jgi:hypothetical protein